MDENVVARQAAGSIKRCLDRLKERSASETITNTINETPINNLFVDGIMDLQQSFPFNVANWDGAEVFLWADFRPQNLPSQGPDPAN